MKNLILHTEQIKNKELFRNFEEDPRNLPIIAEMIKSQACEFRKPLKISVKAFKIRELYEVEPAEVNTCITPDGRKKAYVKLVPENKAADLAVKLGVL